jgi:hypothetical protein
VDQKKRRSFAAETLVAFHEIVQRHNLPWSGRQTKDNCINLHGRVSFECGDLRVHLKSCFVVVEAESGAMVGNLVKYWYMLEKQLVDRPIILFHLYSQSTPNNLASQKELWQFFLDKMENTFAENLPDFCFRMI